ncbi:MAG: ATP-binding protein [Cyanobacteriota bacterium]|nr:ATP-binding protein [Cyanobacteriota bacterium]
MLKRNDEILQSEFTLSLVESLDPLNREETLLMSEYPNVSVCKPVEEALSHHVEKERLLNQVTAQTHQRLKLPEILENTVEQVCDFLNVDRLVIYQLDGYSSQQNIISDDRFHDNRDCITYEAKKSADIPSLQQEKEIFKLGLVSQYRDLYLQGFTLAVDDTELAYARSPKLIEALKKAKIRSQFIAPIIVQNHLWGLLIAHQCLECRHWQQSEKDFIRHITEHLGVAIYQAQLYAQVQQQKQTLEQQVNERTQALRDALVSAQAANRFKSEFLATISHELRTPLTCVIGMSSTLLRWSVESLSDKQKRYIQTIYNSGEHLLELIEDLLDFSELESGKTILDPSEFSLTQLARDSLRTIADRAAVDGVELRLDLSLESEGDRFCADLGRVRHILFNLLSNAVKFTQTGGTVTLYIGREENEAVIEVEDTGIGIPEDRQSQLFQSFKQLDASYNRQYGGAGLGLALTKQLVELHGGQIEVESTVGVGSKFTVRLPMQSIDNGEGNLKIASKPPSFTPVNPLSQGHIVLIADREDDATLICNILTAAGYQVVWMIEGCTALDKIQLLEPSVAIVDRGLTGMDGRDIVSTLRSLPSMQSLKILLIDDLSTPEAEANCLACGANDCVGKPMEPELLLAKLITLLSTSTPEVEPS